jgi:hypothetical protein
MSGCANDGSTGAAGSTGADGADGNAQEVTITAVDGYIIGANVTDANGNLAFKNGDGTYSFVKEPKYPLSASGGTLKDTGEDFTGTMYAAKGVIVSPLTTLITKLDSDGNPLAEEDTTRLQQLVDMYGGSVSTTDLTADYVSSSNEAVAKLA